MRKWCLAAALAACLALTGCGSGSDGGDAAPGGTAPGPAELVEAAKKEGSLVWYGGSSEKGLSAAAKAFEETYGIKVSYVRLVTAQIAQRFGAEVSAGKVQADVLSTVDPRFFSEQREKGNLAALSPEEIPSLAAFSDQYKVGDAAVVVGVTPYLVAWNTDVIKTVRPSHWKDLLDPAFKNEIILADPRKSAAWAQVWSAVLRDPDLGEEYIKSFVAQGFRQVVDSAVSGNQLLAAGEAGLLFATTTPNQEPLVAQGAPLEGFTLSDPGPSSWVHMAITAKAPHPNAARLFLNWITSEEGQTAYNSAEKQASPLGSLEGTLPMPEGATPPDPEQAEADLPKIVELLGLE